MKLSNFKTRNSLHLDLKGELSNLVKTFSVVGGIISGRKALTGPRRVSVEVTHYCNLNCEFCASHGSRIEKKYPQLENYYKGRATMEFDLYQSLVDDLAALGTRTVTFSGKGEPLMKDDISRYIRYAKEKGLRCKIITNGVLLGEKVEEILKAGVDEVSVSVNAADRKTYERVTGKDLFLEVVSSVEKIIAARKESTPVYLTNVITSRTYKDLPAMARLGARLGVDGVDYFVCGAFKKIDDLELESRHIREVKSVISEVKELEKKLDIKTNVRVFEKELDTATQSWKRTNRIQTEVPCYAGWIFSVVAPDGRVFPCCYCKNSLGNIYENSFKEIWYSSKYNKFRRAGKLLPRKGKTEALEKCPCFTVCNFWSNNLLIFKALHPLSSKGARAPFFSQ